MNAPTSTQGHNFGRRAARRRASRLLIALACCLAAASGLLVPRVQAAPHMPVNLTLTPSAVQVDEGGSATFQVSLDAQPAADVTLSVERLGGDADFSVKSGATLTIPRAAWTTPATVTLQAAEDPDTTQNQATFRVRETSLNGIPSANLTATEYDNDNARLVTDVNVLPVPEGVAAVLRVWLDSRPTTDVTFTVTRVGGDADLTAFDSGTITAANWSNPVLINIMAAEDADSLNSSAIFRVQATNYTAAPADVTARESDNEPDASTLVGGTISANTVWNDTSRDYVISSPVVIPAGVTLTIAPGVVVRQSAQNSIAFDVSGTLRIQNGARLAMYTYTPHNWEVAARRSAILLRSGAAGDFDRAEFQSLELSNQSANGPDDAQNIYWSAIVHALDGARLTARGCRFEGLGRVDGYMTPYGVRLDAAATAEITDSTSTLRSIRTAWRNLRAGVGWVAGAASKRVDLCDFANCPVAGVHIQGDILGSTVTLANPDNLIASHDGASLRVKPGAALRLSTDAGVRSVADRWLYVENGGRLVFDHAFARMVGSIHVAGRFDAYDSTLFMKTYTPYNWDVGARRNGVIIGSGGVAHFEHVDFNTHERCDQSNNGVDHDSQIFWSAGLLAEGSASVTLRGCRFTNLPGDNGWRTPVGLRLEGGASAVVEDSVTTSVVRSAFEGYQAGIEWEAGAGLKRVEACDFARCDRNLRLWGDSATDITLNSPLSVVGSHSGAQLLIKSGARLTLNPGSALHTRNRKQVIIASGAQFLSTNAALHTYGQVQVQGSATLTSTTMVAQTYNPYSWEAGNRQNGLWLQSGGAAALRNCSLYFSEAGDHASWREHDVTPTWQEWAAMIYAQAGSSFTIDRCAFNHGEQAAGRFTTYGIRTETRSNWSVTNSVFAKNAVALAAYDLPATPVFTGNDIRNASIYAVYNVSNSTLPAPDVYWGDPTGPAHMSNPGGAGGRVSNKVDFATLAISPRLPQVELLSPVTGPESCSLTSQTTQLGAELFGFRVAPAGSVISQIAFRVSGWAGGMAAGKFANFRLALDANGDGAIDSGETTLVGGRPTLIASGSDLLVTFQQPFTTPVSASSGYILVADLDNLESGAAFTVQIDQPGLRTSLATGILARTASVRQYAGTGVTLADPVPGQVSDQLAALAEQTSVTLFGFRLLGPGREVERVDFQLSGIVDINTLKFKAVRLCLDNNNNGLYDAGDTVIAPAPGSFSINATNGTGVLTFIPSPTSLAPTGRGYLLVADLRGLMGGDSLTVSLAPSNIDLAGSEIVADGWAAPATHIADQPLLLAPMTDWTPPANFGAVSTNIPLLGFQIQPAGRAIDGLIVELSSVYGIAAADILSPRLVWDRNGNGVIDSGEPIVASGAVVNIQGKTGTVAFPNRFYTRGNLIFAANIANLASADELTVAISHDGVFPPAGWTVSGDLAPVRHLVGPLPREGANRNMKWTLGWRSPGGAGVSGRFNHAGDRVILGYDTGSAWIYDAAANTPLVMLKDHYDKVRYAGFSSDDSAAVTVSRDGAVYIWDLKTSGTLRSAMFSDLLVEYAVPSPDFRKLMVITQGKGMLLDLDTQQRLWEFVPAAATVNAIAYSPDGQWIALGASDKRGYVLNAATGVELYRFTGHSQAVTGVAFTGDGKTLMTASADATMQLWRFSQSLNRWTVNRSISLSGQSAQGAAVSNNGQRACMITGSGDAATLRMFDGATGLELYQVNINSASGGNWGGTLENVTFDDDAQRVLIASSGKGWAQTSCFRVADGAYLQSWGPQGRFSGDYAARPRASADGSRLFYQTDWGMNLLFRQLNKSIRRSPNLPGDYRFGVDDAGGRLAWVNEGQLKVDAVSDSGFAQLLRSGFTEAYTHNLPLSIAPDGAKVAIGDRLFSAATGGLLANYASPDGSYESAFSRDGRLWGFALANQRALVTCLSDDPNATLYNMMLTDPYTPFKILYHPDGVRIGAVDRTIGVQMYDMDKDQPVGLYRFEAGDCTDAALSDDGSLLLIGGAGVAKLFDVQTGRVLRYFYPMHSGLQDVVVRSVQFAANDTQIVIAWSYNYIEVYERSQAARLEVSPAARTLAAGQSQPFRVEVVYDDTTRRDVTPRPDQDDTSVSLEIVPAGMASVTNNVIKVAAGAAGQFMVRARYREGGQTLIGEAVVTVGSARLLALRPDPDKLAVNPGVFRPISYTAVYEDGYELDVTPDVTLSADRPDEVELSGQNVKVLFTARPGQFKVTGSYTDPLGATASADTSLVTFGPRTAWERHTVTGGGYGVAGDFSPDGTQFAAGSSSGAINLYAVGATPTQYAMKHVLQAHASPVVFVGYLDGANAQIASAGQDGAIKTWAVDRPTTAPLSVYQHDAQLQCAALICDNGQRHMVIGDTLGRVALIDLTARRALWTITPHVGAVNAVAIDGDTVLSGGADGKLKVISRANGQLGGARIAHTKGIISLGFMNVNDQAGFYTIGEDKTLVRWTKSNLTITGKPFEYPTAPTAAAVVGETLYVATSSPPATWVYNKNGLLLRWLEHPPAEGVIKKLMITPGGAYILTGRATGKKSVALKFMGADVGSAEAISPFSSFQFWEAGRGIYRGSLAHSFPLAQAHASADGRTIFTQDPKRTMAWSISRGTTQTATRLMETGYFIAPAFAGMDFKSDDSLLATRVGSSIFMYDTKQSLLWKTLHVPGAGPFALSPGGTRLVTADSKTRLWDLANLSMIDENPHLAGGFDFVGENQFLGGVTADKFLGVFNAQNVMANGTSTRHQPSQVYVNRAGTRAIVISKETRGGGFLEPTSNDYYAETYNISNLAAEPQFLSQVYLFTVTEDPLGIEPSINPSISVSVSEDATMALIGASGDQPVKLISLADGSTIREFTPPTGRGETNIGAASVEFLPGDQGVMIGWGEGYAELWRRLAPVELTLQVNAYLPPASLIKSAAQQALTADLEAHVKVRPGQTLWISSLARYANGDKLNVTPATAFVSSAPAVAVVRGSMVTISPSAQPQLVTLSGQYAEPGKTLSALITLEIVGDPLAVSGISQAGYVVDTIAAGKRLYVDATSSFTLPIPGDLLGQLYIRTKLADRNTIAAGTFLQFTVNQDSRVIVAIDPRLVQLPAWLAGWTELPAQLGCADAQPARRLFQKFFPAGVVALGSNRETGGPAEMRMYNVIIANPDIGQTGIVEVRPNPTAGRWILETPLGQKIVSAGVRSLTAMPTGSYKLTWVAITNWSAPLPVEQTAYLERNGRLVFDGQFARHAGSVRIMTIPRNAPWKLTDVNGKTTQGKGDRLLIGVPTGATKLEWLPLEGYATPSSSAETKTLIRDGMVSFLGVYSSQTDSIENNMAAIMQHLLGLRASEAWMDANKDSKITVTDAIHLREHATIPYPTLLTPAWYGANVDPAVTLDWSDCKYATSYDIYIWKNAETEPTAPTASGLTASQYKPAKPLAAQTSYHWYVKAKNRYNQTISSWGYFTTK